MACAARDMDPMKGRFHAQKEKCGIKKVRALVSFLERNSGSACREYAHAVPNGWSWKLSVNIVSGRGVGEVSRARWSWWREAVRDWAREI
jgi:hypothetical protein